MVITDVDAVDTVVGVPAFPTAKAAPEISTASVSERPLTASQALAHAVGPLPDQAVGIICTEYFDRAIGGGCVPKTLGPTPQTCPSVRFPRLFRRPVTVAALILGLSHTF